jgi:hypothetical protein
MTPNATRHTWRAPRRVKARRAPWRKSDALFDLGVGGACSADFNRSQPRADDPAHMRVGPHLLWIEPSGVAPHYRGAPRPGQTWPIAILTQAVAGETILRVYAD